MNIEIPKKLLVINNIVSMGRCTMSVVLPIISACKVQACPLPTAVFSNHLGFDSYYKKDLTPDMTSFFKNIDMLNIPFDGIYCGLLSSTRQVDIVREYFEKITNSRKNFMILLDPVMGDNGKTYKSITPAYCSKIKELLPYASILTPNITEACLLTNTPYCDKLWSAEELIDISNKLVSLGANKIIITGMKDKDNFYNFTFEDEGNAELYTIPISGSSRHGSGDIFAGIVSAMSLRGKTLSQATGIASDFISLCTKISDEANVPSKEGIIFEMALGELNKLQL